jgi:mannose-6-phosphate isomerase-like protein (cupin superfamily)
MFGRRSANGGTTHHSIAHVVIAPGQAAPRQYHKQSEKTYYILRGSARINIEGAEFTLRPGDACLVVPPEKHQIFNAGDTDLEFISVNAPAWVPEDSVFLE